MNARGAYGTGPLEADADAHARLQWLLGLRGWKHRLSIFLVMDDGTVLDSRASSFLPWQFWLPAW